MVHAPKKKKREEKKSSKKHFNSLRERKCWSSVENPSTGAQLRDVFTSILSDAREMPAKSCQVTAS